ncbi:MAG: hypothetical protein WBX00_25945 [Isosphaeraceae bacterium]
MPDSTSWFKKLASESARTEESHIDQLLADGFTLAQSQLNDGSWRAHFAGKEIFRDIGSRMCDRTRITGYIPKGVEFDVDLAKDIAASQVASSSIPLDLSALLAALKRRIAPTPPAS